MMAWMAGIPTITRKKPMTWTTINAAVAATGKFWTQHGLEWDRKKHPQVADQMKGLKKTNPSTPRSSKPITIDILNKGVRAWAKGRKRDVETITRLCMLYGAYFFGNRVSEYTNRSKHAANRYEDAASCDPDGPTFQWKHLQFIENKHGQVISCVFTIPKSKTNQIGEKLERVEAACCCGHHFAPCLPHLYLECKALRKAKGEIITPSSPVLATNGPVVYAEARTWVRDIIQCAGLNPNEYGTHGLRKGRAVDLARSAVPAWIIKKWGRWKSDLWQRFYAKLDHSDIAKITGSHLMSTTEAIHAADVQRHKKLQDTTGYQLL